MVGSIDLEVLGQEQCGADSERETLSANLHDGALQTLYAVGLQLETAKSLITTAPNEAKLRVSESIQQLNHAIVQLRTLIGDHAQVPPVEGFSEALNSLILFFRRISSTVFCVSIEPGAVVGLSRPQISHLQNIMRGGLFNVVRHARAETCVVQLTRDSHQVRVQIWDDGKGFDITRVRQRSKGLLSMTHRAKRISASLRLWSQPGNGTSLDLVIPL